MKASSMGLTITGVEAWFLPLMDDACMELNQRLHVEGVTIENKGPCLAVHYRQALEPAQARSAILDELGVIAQEDGLAVAEGRMVVELRPPPPLGKGWLLEDLAAERGLKGLIYLGDDRTDIEAFDALREWRDADPGRIGVALAVASPEMPPTLIEAADFVLDDVPAV